MDDDLKNIIPKKENTYDFNNNLESEEKKEKKGFPKYLLIIILIVVIGGFIFGSVIVYNKYIKDQFSPVTDQTQDFDENKIIENIDENITTQPEDCSTEEECFYISLSDCSEDQHLINVSTTSMFLNIVKMEQLIKIKGYDLNNNCVLEINTLDAEIHSDLDSIIEFIEDEDNFENVYFQYQMYLIFTTMGDENSDVLENMPELDKITEEEKESLLEEIKSFAIEFNDSLNIGGELTQEEQEEIDNYNLTLENAMKDIVETCYFENTENLISFVDMKKKGSLIPTSSDSTTSMKDGQAISITTNEYNQGTCVSESLQEITMN
jgi:hypothetical protein